MTFEGLVAQPVGPLVVAVLGSKSLVVIFVGIDVADELVHCFPVLVDDADIAELLPHYPGHDDAGIGPAEAHHIASVLGGRGYSGEGSVFVAAVTHITHPLVEESISIREECSGLGEHLGIRRPAQALIALRAVGRNRQVVGALAPDGVGYQLVHQLVSGNYGSCLQVLADGSHGHGLDALDGHLVRCSDGHVTVAEEGVAGHIAHIAFRGAEGIDGAEAIIGGTEIGAVHAAFGAVHSTALGTVAVVEYLSHQAGQHGSLLSLEHEGRFGGSILPEIHHEGFAGVQDHIPSALVPAPDHYLAVGILRSRFYLLPHIGVHGLEGQVLAEADLCTDGRDYLPLEFLVHLGFRKLFGGLEAGFDAGVVLLAVEDCRVGDGACDAGLPVLGVSAEDAGAAILVGQFQHSAEGRLMAQHPVGIDGSDYLVGPPARGHLDCELIAFSLAGLECAGDVVGIGNLGFKGMGEAGFQGVLADGLAVDIQFIDAETGRHPFGGADFTLVHGFGHEPACSVGGPVVDGRAHQPVYYRSIGHGYPFRLGPEGVVKGIGAYAYAI